MDYTELAEAEIARYLEGNHDAQERLRAGLIEAAFERHGDLSQLSDEGKSAIRYIRGERSSGRTSRMDAWTLMMRLGEGVPVALQEQIGKQLDEDFDYEAAVDESIAASYEKYPEREARLPHAVLAYQADNGILEHPSIQQQKDIESFRQLDKSGKCAVTEKWFAEFIATRETGHTKYNPDLQKFLVKERRQLRVQQDIQQLQASRTGDAVDGVSSWGASDQVAWAERERAASKELYTFLGNAEAIRFNAFGRAGADHQRLLAALSGRDRQALRILEDSRRGFDIDTAAATPLTLVEPERPTLAPVGAPDVESQEPTARPQLAAAEGWIGKFKRAISGDVERDH